MPKSRPTSLRLSPTLGTLEVPTVDMEGTHARTTLAAWFLLTG